MNAYAAQPANVLTIQQLSKKFGSRFAVQQATWSAMSGQIVCLLGHSGCGKTTMLRLIAGLETPSSGTIQLEQNTLWSEQAQIPAEARNIGLVFQDYALFPHLSVLDNVMFGLKKFPKAQRETIAKQALAHVSMLHHQDSYPYTLSGGEQQRVALARALAPEPQVLLMDEPFSNLDHRLRDQIRQSTIQILNQTATTTVIVTHDPEEALQIADQIILMHQGQIIQIGSPKQLYLQPKTLFAARYFSALNEIPAQVNNQTISTIFGQVDLGQQDLAQDLSTQEQVQCCFRPHQVRVSKTPSEGALPACVMSSSFMGHAQQLRLKLRDHDLTLLAQVSHLQDIQPAEQIYVSVDLNSCYFLASDEQSSTTSSSTQAAVQV